MTTAAPRGHWRQAIRTADRRRLDRLAILSVHFNPQRYAAPARNYVRFKAALGPLADRLYSAEANYAGQFETDARLRLDATPQNLLWQKEHLLNCLLRQLPDRVQYVAWVDRDLLFENPDWATETMKMLDTDCAVVQLFDTVALQDRRGEVDVRRHGAVRAHELGEPAVAFGYGWAARRDHLDAIGGFPSMNIIGGADTVMAHTWLRKYVKFATYAPALNNWNAEWADRARREMHGRRCGYVPGEVRHLWHGSRSDRGFSTRHQILQRQNYDPAAHIRLGTNGLLELHDAPELADSLRRYFAARREDR